MPRFEFRKSAEVVTFVTRNDRRIEPDPTHAVITPKGTVRELCVNITNVTSRSRAPRSARSCHRSPRHISIEGVWS